MKWKYKEITYGDDTEQEIHSAKEEIHRFAEELAEHKDNHAAEYPDERCFMIWCPKKECWRKIHVDAESTREYSATEEFG